MSTHVKLFPRAVEDASDPERFLTIAQVAERLCVHPSTVRRWIDHGRLPAYRLGPKRIAVRASDLEGLVMPRASSEVTVVGTGDAERVTFPPLIREEQTQLRAAIDAAYQHQAELLARRDGQLFPSSTELIREAREERTRQLMGDANE